MAKDEVEAVKWFRRAASQGWAEAQHGLGFAYATGAGVAKDEVEAVKWYRQAADRNYAEVNQLGDLLCTRPGGDEE